MEHNHIGIFRFGARIDNCGQNNIILYPDLNAQVALTRK